MARLADPRVRRVIGANLKRLTRGRNKTVADAMKMSVGQLYGYTNGLRGFAIETLIRFAVATGSSIDDLIAGVDAAYTRDVAKRRALSFESDAQPDQELLDVIAGFELMRRTNPTEAATVATMFRARLVPGAVEVLLERDERSGARRAVSTEVKTGTAHGPAKRARR